MIKRIRQLTGLGKTSQASRRFLMSRVEGHSSVESRDSRLTPRGFIGEQLATSNQQRM